MFFWKIIATGFGSGYSPVAPGTAGALAGCLMLWGLDLVWPESAGMALRTGGLLVLVLIFLWLGVKSAGKLEAEWGHDPSRIVVDEMVGVWIGMLWLPVNFTNLALAFVLFRVFDIWKPLGIRKMERLRGGWGVMMDDVLAGVYTWVVIQLYVLVSG